MFCFTRRAGARSSPPVVAAAAPSPAAEAALTFDLADLDLFCRLPDPAGFGPAPCVAPPPPPPPFARTRVLRRGKGLRVTSRGFTSLVSSVLFTSLVSSVLFTSLVSSALLPRPSPPTAPGLGWLRRRRLRRARRRRPRGKGEEASAPSVGAPPLSPSPRLDHLRVASPYPAASPLSTIWTSPGRPSIRRLRRPRRRLRARLSPRDEPSSTNHLPPRVGAHPSIRFDCSRPNWRRLRSGSTVSSPRRRARRVNRASAEEVSRC